MIFGKNLLFCFSLEVFVVNKLSKIDLFDSEKILQFKLQFFLLNNFECIGCLCYFI